MSCSTINNLAPDRIKYIYSVLSFVLIGFSYLFLLQASPVRFFRVLYDCSTAGRKCNVVEIQPRVQ